MEFLRSFLRRHFAGKPVVRLGNVACFLKIDFMITLNEKPLLIESLFALGVGGGGGAPLYKPYRYVPPHRVAPPPVAFLRRFGLNTGIHLWYGFRGKCGCV